MKPKNKDKQNKNKKLKEAGSLEQQKKNQWSVPVVLSGCYHISASVTDKISLYINIMEPYICVLFDLSGYGSFLHINKGHDNISLDDTDVEHFGALFRPKV